MVCLGLSGGVEMGRVIAGYTVMQQNEWADRQFFTAREERTGQVVYLVAEAARDSTEPYAHPNLPLLHALQIDGGTRWLSGPVPAGETLEDLRSQGALTETGIMLMLLSVIDGLSSLSRLQPPVVPAYLDPACIKRDAVGRWMLDYLALAHAPEAHNASHPLGVYPLGALLYWLVTGQTARRTRVQMDRVEGASSTLQYIIIRCLSRSYPSLGELRDDVERAGHEREFKCIVAAGQMRPQVAAAAARTSQAAPVDLHYRRVLIGGPQIPANDRPWALPQRPPDGFRHYVVPPPPDPKLQKIIRRGTIAAAGVLVVGAAALAAIRLGSVPGLNRVAQPAMALPGMTRAGGTIGSELPPSPLTADGRPVASATEPDSGGPDLKEYRRLAHQPRVADEPAKAPAPTQPAPPAKQPQPTRPVLQPPAAGSIAYLDAQAGGTATLIFFNGRPVDWAYLFPHPTSPFMSLNSMNAIFGRNLYWAPTEGGSIRLLNRERSLVTADFLVLRERIWLRLTPQIQQLFGIQVSAYNGTDMYFVATH